MAEPVTVSGKELHRACKMLSMVPVVAGFPQSTFIGIKSGGGKTVLSLASSLSVQAELSTEIPGMDGRAIDRRLLVPFVDPAGEYALTADKTALRVEDGKRRADFQTMESEWNYGQPEEAAGKTELPEECYELLRAAALCASRDSMAPQLNAVRVQLGSKAASVACDNVVLGVATAAVPEVKEKKTVIVPVALVAPMLQERAGEIYTSATQSGFVSDGCHVWAPLAKAARDKFPMKILAQLAAAGRKHPSMMECDIGDLAATCQTFGRYLSAVPPTEWELRFEPAMIGATVTAVTEYVQFQDVMTAEMSEDAEFTLDLKRVQPVVNFLETRVKKARITWSKSLASVLADGYEFFISLKAKKKPADSDGAEEDD